MVASTGSAETKDITTKLSDLQWTTVSISEVAQTSRRLEASVYGVKGKQAREILKKIKWVTKPLNGPDGIADISHRPRFKRIFMEYSGLPIFQPAQITDIKPRPLLFISDKTSTNLDALKVKTGQILLTCSGTVGVSTLVSKSYDGKIFSHDLLRIEPKDDTDSGYIYTFLKSELGSNLVKTNNYGAVVQHIEPEHLEDLYIPYPSQQIRKKIDHLIKQSFKHRDKSNELIDQATNILVAELSLPPFRDIAVQSPKIDNHSVNITKLNGRLEASYHHTKIDRLIDHLKANSKEVTNVGDSELSSGIVLPGRFKRVYVGEKQGAVFFGGKQIFELDPNGKKYLSLLHHGERIKDQLTLKENMILVTCSGTIARVQLTPHHWAGWAANQHILRIIPSSNLISGYLYIWLQSEYGEALIKRNKYGAVVDELDANQMSNVPVPLLNDSNKQALINGLALEANSLRSQAYKLEKEAMNVFNEEVLVI